MSEVSTVGPNPQIKILGVPDANTAAGAPAPFAYLSPQMATDLLTARWGWTYPEPVTTGFCLVASMRLDQEGPFQGVKCYATQERSWPRTFRYGWPNIVAAPTPILVAIQNPGAWPLNYEAVIPREIVDWCMLEMFRMQSLPLIRPVERESVTGASVTYAPPHDVKGGWQSVIDDMMAALISPFLMRSGRTTAFTNLTGL